MEADRPNSILRLPPRSDGLRRAEGGRRLVHNDVGTPGPLVSYVTVVRNASATLARTLASVKAQRAAQVEHIVIDGLSSDGTLQLIQDHATQIDYYVSEPDDGLYEALNKALSLTRGSLICVLNADDWLTPDAAALALRALKRLDCDPMRPAPRLILTAAWLYNGSRRQLWMPGQLTAASWLRCPDICHNGVYATPGALAAAGLYDTRLRIVADSRWLLAAMEAGVDISRVNAPTVHYVTGGLSSDGKRHVEECARLLALRFPSLTVAETWTLLHAFYPWTGNLAPFAEFRPPHLGRALEALVARHSDDRQLQISLTAAEWDRQRGYEHRRPMRTPFVLRLGRRLKREWYEARERHRDSR